jgi:hypothetical protein
VTESGGYLFVGDMLDLGWFCILDVHTPESPVGVVSLKTPYTVNDIAVSDGYAYVSEGDAGLQIISLESMQSAHIVGSLDPPFATFGSVAASRGHVLVVEEGIDGLSALRIVDVNPPESAYTVKKIFTPSSEVAVSGRYAYLVGIPNGLRVIELW